MCALLCVPRKSKAKRTAAFILTHRSIRPIQKMKKTFFLSFPPLVSFSNTTPASRFSLSLSQFSLSHNFFQSCHLTPPPPLQTLKLYQGPNLLQPSSWNAINPSIPISVHSEITRPLATVALRLMKTTSRLLLFHPEPELWDGRRGGRKRGRPGQHHSKYPLNICR